MNTASAAPRLGRCLSKLLPAARAVWYPLRTPRQLHTTAIRLQIQQSNPTPSPTPNAIPDPPEDDDSTKGSFRAEWGPTFFKMFESAATTFASIAILGLIGYSYTRYYKYLVLKKMDNAFKPGDPVLELANTGAGPGSEVHWIERDEQKAIDAIIDGSDRGHYFLIIGEKGTGKTSMILEAMRKVQGDGISMFDAHADLEIFRIRLGRALDFEYHEDNIGSLFSIRGPRDGSALLDIERAFNKLEKVALRRRAAGKPPLILVINSMHLVRDDADGQDLLELIQQRAEAWCASSLATVVLNSDDYWVYERLKRHATRMELLPVLDLKKGPAMDAIRKYRRKLFKEQPSEAEVERVYDRVGGRLAFLARAAKSENMQEACDDICDKEKTWLLNQCWILGPEMDDDVMDQQKYASAAMVLAKALVDKEMEMEQTFDPMKGHLLPEIPLHEARQIMTRADFIQAYDQINIFTINSRAMVRADSVPMMNAFRQICSVEGFDEHLEGTLDRISDIESLGRTREITLKDLWKKGKYITTASNGNGRVDSRIVFEVEKPEEKGS